MLYVDDYIIKTGEIYLQNPDAYSALYKKWTIPKLDIVYNLVAPISSWSLPQ